MREFRPELVSCHGTEEEKATLLSTGCADCNMEDMVTAHGVDLVVTATAGDIALAPTFASIEAGKNIALANKETVIMAGEMVTARCRERGVSLLPLDSEPNAIWQCLRGEEKEVSRLIITASGGAFRNAPWRSSPMSHPSKP